MFSQSSASHQELPKSHVHQHSGTNIQHERCTEKWRSIVWCSIRNVLWKIPRNRTKSKSNHNSCWESYWTKYGIWIAIDWNPQNVSDTTSGSKFDFDANVEFLLKILMCNFRSWVQKLRRPLKIWPLRTKVIIVHWFDHHVHLWCTFVKMSIGYFISSSRNHLNNWREFLILSNNYRWNEMLKCCSWLQVLFGGNLHHFVRYSATLHHSYQSFGDIGRDLWYFADWNARWTCSTSRWVAWFIHRKKYRKSKLMN